MKTAGQLSYRIASMLMLVLLILVAASPVSTAAAANPIPAAAPFASDDFNRCSVGPNWTFGPTGTTAPAPTITGAYTGSSYVSLTVPPGQDLTFNGTKQDAPRLMTPTSSTQDWEIEVAFLNPMGTPPANSWFIQGVLVRDTTSVPGKSRWLRFDFNANSTSNTVNYYVAYINEDGVQTSIQNVSALQYTRDAAPLNLGVHYQAASSTWTFSYHAGTDMAWHSKTPFVNTNVKPDQVGVFASATGPNAAVLPGFVSKVDYVRDWVAIPDSNNWHNDETTLTVNTTGQGTVSQACSGVNTMTLTAKPQSGVGFSGWTGTVSSTQNPLVLQMPLDITQPHPYTITAAFGGSPVVTLPNKVYIPVIDR